MNPLTLFETDRAAARKLDDQWANVCVVSSVNAAGEPEARVLVLRNQDEQLAIFFNATSPKFVEFSQSKTVSVLTFMPSIQLQYRLRCVLEPIDESTVHESWGLRGDAPKRMDWLYERHSQSTEIGTREALLAGLEALTLPDPLVAPDTACGFYLRASEVERLDLNQSNGVHDRRLYRRVDDSWSEAVLVP